MSLRDTSLFLILQLKMCPQMCKIVVPYAEKSWGFFIPKMGVGWGDSGPGSQPSTRNLAVSLCMGRGPYTLDVACNGCQLRVYGWVFGQGLEHLASCKQRATGIPPPGLDPGTCSGMGGSGPLQWSFALPG